MFLLVGRSLQRLSKRQRIGEVLACRSSSKPWLERLWLWMSLVRIQSIKSKRRSKTKKEYLPTNSDWSLQGSNWKMVEHWQITIFKRSQLCIWSSVYAVKKYGQLRESQMLQLQKTLSLWKEREDARSDWNLMEILRLLWTWTALFIASETSCWNVCKCLSCGSNDS